MKKIIILLALLNFICTRTMEMSLEEQRKDCLYQVQAWSNESSLTQSEKLFFRAAISGYYELVQDCLKQPININAEDKNGETALFHACYWGRYSVAIHLLQQKNIEVNTVSKTASSKRTPLHFACSNDNPKRLTDIQQTQLISHLIAAGANPDKKNIYHETPLHSALQSTSSEPVKLLIAAGASMLERPNGITPLQEADSLRRIDHVRALLTSPKITIDDVKSALQFNKNCRSDLVRKFREELRKYFRFISLDDLHAISNIPTDQFVSSQTRALSETIKHDVEAYFKSTSQKDHPRLIKADETMQAIGIHQDIYRALFQYYRTQKMLGLAQRPANKEFPMPRLFSIPVEVRKMLPALAAQEDIPS